MDSSFSACSIELFCCVVKSKNWLFLDPDSAHRAGIGGIHGLRHLLRRDRAGLCHSQAYDKGGFPMDRVYIIAIVAAIVLLAIHLIRDYGNRE